MEVVIAHDQIVERVINSLETRMPGGFRAYYLVGSHADNMAVRASDVDIVALARSASVIKAETQVICSKGNPTRVSVQIQTLKLLASDPWSLALFRGNSVLLRGEDVRAQLPEVDVDAFAREVVGLSRCFMTLGRGGGPLHLPLIHPDESDEFYGRAHVTAPSLYEPPVEEGTKEMTKAILWLTTAILAVQHRIIAGSAGQAIERYERVGGTWSGFVRESVRLCKHEWNYEVPREASERTRLREICRELLDFERHFVTMTPNRR
jgi:hypothetical protein